MLRFTEYLWIEWYGCLCQFFEFWVGFSWFTITNQKVTENSPTPCSRDYKAVQKEMSKKEQNFKFVSDKKLEKKGRRYFFQIIPWAGQYTWIRILTYHNVIVTLVFVQHISLIFFCFLFIYFISYLPSKSANFGGKLSQKLSFGDDN